MGTFSGTGATLPILEFAIKNLIHVIKNLGVKDGSIWSEALKKLYNQTNLQSTQSTLTRLNGVSIEILFNLVNVLCVNYSLLPHLIQVHVMELPLLERGENNQGNFIKIMPFKESYHNSVHINW